jgi:hypothetical protein
MFNNLLSDLRNVWRNQMGNQKPFIKEGQTKRQLMKYKIFTKKIKDRETWTPLK